MQDFVFIKPARGGKTTICNLIPRFYEITGVSISLDGIDIHQIKKQSLRTQIGIVQQDVFLFAGTIRENIAYGKPNATSECSGYCPVSSKTVIPNLFRNLNQVQHDSTTRIAKVSSAMQTSPRATILPERIICANSPALCFKMT